MVFFDSSGTNKDGARKEHRDALASVVSASKCPEADPLAVTCAVDWLLYDWLMAHRDGPDSAEIVFPRATRLMLHWWFRRRRPRLPPGRPSTPGWCS